MAARGSSLLDVMFEDESETPLVDQTEWTQPAMFALEYALGEAVAVMGCRARRSCWVTAWASTPPRASRGCSAWRTGSD